MLPLKVLFHMEMLIRVVVQKKAQNETFPEYFVFFLRLEFFSEECLKLARIFEEFLCFLCQEKFRPLRCP